MSLATRSFAPLHAVKTLHGGVSGRLFTLLCVLVIGSMTACQASAHRDATAEFSELLGRHVDAKGLVDYAGMASDPTAMATLEAVIAEAAVSKPDATDDHRLATLMNVYNAAVLKVLLDNGVGTSQGVSTILDVEGGKVFDNPRLVLDGKKVSLNELEKNHVAPLAGDARYHFAVNCGAYSCPALRNEAYVGDRVQAQLDEQRAQALTADAPRFLRWKGNGVVEATKLMDWYGEEFGDPIAYLNAHADLPGKVTEVTFLEYDWALNAQ